MAEVKEALEELEADLTQAHQQTLDRLFARLERRRQALVAPQEQALSQPQARPPAGATKSKTKVGATGRARAAAARNSKNAAALEGS